METSPKIILHLFLFVFILSFDAFAQPRCKVEYYSAEQGLSQQRITTIVKDQEGFMWFGSWNGINRFDGHSFSSYQSSLADKYQLSSNRIDRIVEDQSNHLWIQTGDNQIYRFDKTNEQFLPLSVIVAYNDISKADFQNILHTAAGWVWLQSKDKGIFCVPQNKTSGGQVLRYSKDESADYQLPSNQIKFLHEDQNHRIWIGTSRGLTCLVRRSSGVYIKNKIIPSNFFGKNFTRCVEDSFNIYFGTDDGEVIIFTKRQEKFTSLKITAARITDLLLSKRKAALYVSTSQGELIEMHLGNQQIAKYTYPTSESLSTLFEERSGALWMQPQIKGAIRFDPLSHSFQLYSLNTEKQSTGDNRFFKVVEDYNGTVWVCVKGGGLGYFNPGSKTLESVVTTTDGEKYQLPENIRDLYYDLSGVLWLKTNKPGILKMLVQTNNFLRHSVFLYKCPQKKSEVKGMYYDNKSRLWLGTKKGKLLVYTKGDLINDVFVNEPAGGVAGVYCILQDSRGVIWLGTKGNGLFKATPVNREETKYRLAHFMPDKNNPDSLPGNSIYALLEDRQGRIWMGTMGDRLVLIEEKPGFTRFVQRGPAFKNYPKGRNFRGIRHMTLDKDGNIWLGTTSGLLVLNPNDSFPVAYNYKSYTTIPGDKQSLGNNDIQFIFQDSKKRMWLATSGGGLCQAVGGNPLQSLRFRNYTVKDGLPHNYILSCTQDKKGNLWLATENGLSRFNPETNTFRNYDSYDGLPKLSFSEASVVQQKPGGEILFGTSEGYLSLNLERVNAIPIETTIAFTNLQINNEDAGPGANEKLLKDDINYISELRLNHNENIISIDYAILDYRSGDRQPFAYRLVGFDSTWHNDRRLHRATYTNLSPGHYVFEVKALPTDLYVNQPYRRIEITILPPWWKTWWAYVVYAIIIGAFIYFIARNAREKMRLRNEIVVEQKLAALKMNFFTNISHELRTPLTLIVSPLEQIAKKGKLSPDLVCNLNVARRNASRMVRFVNQLLDLRKVQSDKAILHISRVELVSFVRQIADHFTEAANSKDLKLEILSDCRETIVWVDAEKLDVVIYNLLSNAVKFTPEGKRIIVNINTIGPRGEFTIIVRDEGPGVGPDELASIFELFHGGKEGNGSKTKGTGIGLALSKEFVELHGGNIWAENNEGGGLIVTVTIKEGSPYPSKDKSLTNLLKTDAMMPITLDEKTECEAKGKVPSYKAGLPLVLLVEDNDELRNFISSQLGEYYRVETAKNGAEGLQRATIAIPDLIISDIMMPLMDGIEMLDRLKKDHNTSHIPVVLLSAKHAIESQIEGLDYGADCYITKPFNHEFLIASINNLLRQRKRLFEALVKKQKVALSPQPVSITSKDEIFLKEVIKVVEQKIGDAGFRIEAIAECMAMTHKTFYRKFRSLTGLTPVEFVKDMRLQRAKQLLDAGADNIAEVAYNVGFSVPSYFSTCFKEKYHISPSDYIRVSMT